MTDLLSCIQAAAKRKEHQSLQKALSYWQMLTLSTAFCNWRETCWVRFCSIHADIALLRCLLLCSMSNGVELRYTSL